MIQLGIVKLDCLHESAYEEAATWLIYNSGDHLRD